MLRRRNSNNDQQPSILLRLILGLAILSALPAIHQRHARVLARPAMATIEVEEQSEEQQLVELIDQQQNNKRQQTSAGKETSEILDDKFISYGLRDNNAREREQQLQDAFFELDPEPRVGRRPSSTTDAVDRGRIWLANGGGSGAREQKTNRRNGQREEERQHLGDEDSATPPLHGGKSLPPLTSADVVNSTLLQASNCRGDLFKHKVRVLGCRPKFFTNRFCHGSCSSVYIPRLRSKKLKATFQSCAACVPSETDLIQVRLDCPDHPQGQKLRTVVRVKKCACRNIVLDDPPEDEPPLHEDGDELPGTDSDDGVATVVEEEEEDE